MKNEKDTKKTAPKGTEKQVSCEALIDEGVSTSVGTAYRGARISLPESEAKALASNGKVKLL